jgi:hypothetical protein
MTEKYIDSSKLRLYSDPSCESIIHHDLDKDNITIFLTNNFYKDHISKYMFGDYSSLNIVSIPDIIKTILKSNLNYDFKIKVSSKSLTIIKSSIEPNIKINLILVIPLLADFIQNFKKELCALPQITNIINNLSYDSLSILKEFRPYILYTHRPLYNEITIPIYKNSLNDSLKILKNINEQKIDQYYKLNINKEYQRVQTYHKKFFKNKPNKLKFSYNGVSFFITGEYFKAFDYHYKIDDSEHILKYLYLIGQLDTFIYDIESCKLTNI